jgi:phosphate transport system substrate-binding protein
MVLEGGDFASSVQTLAGTAAVINAVAKDPGAMGYGGIGYSAGAKLLQIELPSGESLAPTDQNVRSGAYPLARPLFFYLNPKRLKPATSRFCVWILSDEGQAAIAGAGYYALSGETLEASRATLEKAIASAAPKAATAP